MWVVGIAFVVWFVCVLLIWAFFYGAARLEKDRTYRWENYKSNRENERDAAKEARCQS